MLRCEIASDGESADFFIDSAWVGRLTASVVSATIDLFFTCVICGNPRSTPTRVCTTYSTAQLVCTKCYKLVRLEDKLRAKVGLTMTTMYNLRRIEINHYNSTGVPRQ